MDSSFQKVAYQDIKKSSNPLHLKLVVEFQQNGQPWPQMNNALRMITEQVLISSGIVYPVIEQEAGEIKVVVNNIADTGGATVKGFGSGLTFGFIGTTVMDTYEMSISITTQEKTIRRTAIKHALYTAIGNTSLPKDVEIASPQVTFGKVLEQMLLRALLDMQKSGDLTWLNRLNLFGSSALHQYEKKGSATI